jgi:hypothetical protein
MGTQDDHNEAEVDLSDEKELVEDTFDDEKESYGFNLSSGIFFVVASVLYVWLSVVGFDYEYEIQDIPDDVLEADDLLSWAPYIKDGSYEDDSVFHAGDTWVSRYQILYFAAAICFVITGVLECFIQPGFLGACFTLAGLFGVASAMYVESDDYIASVLNSVSVHLFMLEAFSLLYHHDYTGWIKYYIRVGDIFWVGGTVMDVVLSYYAIWGSYGLRHSKVEIVAAVLWLACSVILLSSTIYLKGKEDEEEEEIDEEAMPDGNPGSTRESTLDHEETQTGVYEMPEGNPGSTRESMLAKRKVRKKKKEQFKGMKKLFYGKEHFEKRNHSARPAGED